MAPLTPEHACNAETIAPVVIAGGESGVSLLTQSGAWLYWVGDRTIRRTSKLGAGVIDIASSAHLNSFVVDATRAYWTDPSAGNGVFSVLHEGGAVSKAAGSDGAPKSLALGPGSTVYYTTSPSSTTGESVVDSLSPPPGKPQQALVSKSPIGPFVLDDTSVFWFAGDTGAIMKTPQGSTSSVLVAAASLPDVTVLAVDDAALYWIYQRTGSLRRVAKSGGDPSELALTENARSFAIDNGFVYWAEERSGRIRRVSKAGGTPETIAVAERPSDVLVDKDCVYWGTRGQLVKMSKPR